MATRPKQGDPEMAAMLEIGKQPDEDTSAGIVDTQPLRSEEKRAFLGERKPIPGTKRFKTLTSIEQAKDRAQVTASTSMSIIHVALLKDLWDSGPDGNSYYNLSLGFILTALILQIISGVISLYVALLRFYYTEYKDDFLDDCFKTCCPWRYRRIRHDHIKDVDTWIEKPDIDERNKAKSKSSMSSLEDPDCGDKASCCPFECTTMRFAEYEYQILDLYDTMAEKEIRAELQKVKFDIEKEWLTTRVNKLRKDLERYKTLDPNDDVEDRAARKSIEAQLKEINDKKEEIEKKMKTVRETKEQAAVLEGIVENIQEERILKRATFWQNWLNMMMYAVFVLNALIAGIGLSDNSSGSAVVPPTNPSEVNSFINATA